MAKLGAMKLSDPATKIKNMVTGMAGNTIILVGRAIKETRPDILRMRGMVNI
jgi:hypothetical protein